jgi:hypothetical protein
MSLRTFFPIDNDDLTVHALEPARIAVNAGRAVLIFQPAEAVNLADSLIRAAQVCGHAGPVPAIPAPAAATVDDAMVKRGIDAWQQWWNDYRGTPREALEPSIRFLLEKALEVKP